MRRTSHSWLPPCALLLVLALAGCRQVGTRVHNLNQLHDEDGRHMRSGLLMTDFSYTLHSGFLGIFSGVEETADKAPKRFDDPVKECLENLIELAHFDPDKPRNRAVQLEWFARLAVADPWSLSREFSVRRLGRIGKGLDVGQDEPPDPEAPLAGPQDARDLLARLVPAVRPLVARRGVLPAFGFYQTPPEWDEHAEDAPPELAQICLQIDALNLDLDGALRVLRATALLEAATAPADRRVEPLRATVARLERTCVRAALLAALQDLPPGERAGSHPGWESPQVRAAALTAAVKVLGTDVLAQYLLILESQEPAVLLAVLGLVRARGLPRPESVPDDEWPLLRAAWIRSILFQGLDHPDGQVRMRALRALATVRGDGSHSLSEDDWYAWWRDEVLPAARDSKPTPPTPPAQ